MTSTTKVFNRPHTIIPEEDTILMLEQKPCVFKFWHQCWLADPYGSRWMKLTTNLSDSAFRFARRILEATRLFLFRRISSGSDGRTSSWEVINLHGARVKDFWHTKNNEAVSASNKADTAPNDPIPAPNDQKSLLQIKSEQALQEPSGTPHEHITNSSKEFVMCDSQADGTANAPLEGASPLPLEESVEESPTATDEKWSPEAIAARSKLRPIRQEKLKMAQRVAENPGFDFLLSCWEDDPALHFVIKQLLVKFPHWRITCVDGELVEI